MTAKGKRKETADHRGHLRAGTGANTWREFFQREKVIEQSPTLFRHQEKKSSYSIGRSSNHMEMSGALEQQEDKAPPDCWWAGQGQGWCKMQPLVPTTQLCPESLPRTGTRVFFPVQREMATCHYFSEEYHWMLSRKFTLGLCNTTLSFLCSKVAFLSQGMEIPGCEWNPFSSALGHGSTILHLSNLQLCG